MSARPLPLSQPDLSFGRIHLSLQQAIANMHTKEHRIAFSLWYCTRAHDDVNSIWERGGRVCNCQKLETGRISCGTKNRTRLPSSSQFHILQLPFYFCRQQGMKLHRNSSQPFLIRWSLCYNAIHDGQSKRALRSNSWNSFWTTCKPYLTNKLSTQLFCSYFYSHFHPHAS